MASLSGITEYDSASATSASSNPFDAKSLASGQDFFRVLSAQLQAQDPLNPMDDTQFLAQLTQQSQLEQTLETNTRLGTMVTLQESLAALQQMTQSAALIGKTVDFIDPYTGEAASGTVDAVRVVEGLVVLDVGGEAVPLPNLTSIREQE
ncbi:MAG: flagellar biosynthesis protein FlgD [Planctomycetes bacterium]|nr:flagellar biosynthesis protein FlgD [Planctomycetota bacterium]